MLQVGATPRAPRARGRVNLLLVVFPGGRRPALVCLTLLVGATRAVAWIPAATTAMSSAALFELMGEGIKAQGPELVKKVNGIIQFNVKPDMAYTSAFTVPPSGRARFAPRPPFVARRARPWSEAAACRRPRCVFA